MTISAIITTTEASKIDKRKLSEKAFCFVGLVFSICVVYFTQSLGALQRLGEICFFMFLA